VATIRDNLTISIPKEQIAKIRQIARVQDRPISRVAAQAISEGLANLEAKHDPFRGEPWCETTRVPASHGKEKGTEATQPRCPECCPHA
jgi:hypothetical protein